MRTRRITRRLVLGSVGAASLSPALPCEARSGDAHTTPALAPAPEVRSAFTVDLELGTPLVTASSHRHWAVVNGGRVAGPRWNGVVTAGHVDYFVNESGAAEIVSRVMLRTTLGQTIELQQRALTAVQGEAGTQMNLRCELSRQGGEGEPWPALFIGRLDASALAEGRLRSMVFEVV